MATTAYPDAARRPLHRHSNMGLFQPSDLTLSREVVERWQTAPFQIALPAAACLIGLLLYSLRPLTYVTFSLWVWFVAHSSGGSLTGASAFGFTVPRAFSCVRNLTVDSLAF